MIKQIIVASHHGFCMGVKRAINIAEETSRNRKGRVTILNEIVHNDAVVERFKSKGVDQAKSVDDVTEGTLIISAHGVAPDVIRTAKTNGLKVIDATCPLVANIYDIIHSCVQDGCYIVHFGDAGHDETKGVVGQAPDKITVFGNVDELAALPEWTDRKLGMTIQTTADMAQTENIKIMATKKWPHLKIFDTICNATDKRQQAIQRLAPEVDMVLVVGSKTSANSKRLVTISESSCGRAYLINTFDDILDEWFDDNLSIERVGISAGASTPGFLIEGVVNRLVEISGGKAEIIQQKVS